MNDVRVIERPRRDTLGEGPHWSPRDRAVYWCDILERRLNRLSLASDHVETWEMPDVIGWVIEQEAGGFVAGVGRSVVTLGLDPLTIEPFAHLPGEPPENRVNDAKADPHGRIWLGTMPFDCGSPTGSVYLLDHGTVTRVAQGYTIANGPAIDPDGRWLLHTDSKLRTIFRYPIEGDRLGSRTPFIAFEDGWGDPDGMTLDAEGHLWVACWGASCVTRFDPDGRRERSIALPASQITSCTFAGEALDRMFVTSAGGGVDEELGGALFEVDPGCRGLPTHRYRD